MWDPCLIHETASNTTVSSEILDMIKCVSKFNVRPEACQCISAILFFLKKR